MSQTLTISNTLYAQLEHAMRLRGLQSLEQLLQTWQAREDELRCRQVAVRRIDALREQLVSKYGTMHDSVELVRQARER